MRCIAVRRLSCAGLEASGCGDAEPRKGRNPKTGDKVDVPPKKVPYFKPGKELKELINREPDADGQRGGDTARCRRSRHRRSLMNGRSAALQRRVRRRGTKLPRYVCLTMDQPLEPWRLAYVTGGAKSDGCVFCAAQSSPDAESLIVFRGSTSLRHPQPVSLQ